MGLLSEKNKEVLLGPLSVNNPVIVQMLVSALRWL